MVRDKKASVIIIHGAYGNPGENWFPWLKSELEKLGCKVFVPKFPTPGDRSFQSWLGVFKDYERYLNEQAIVVGHSIGPAFLLTVLEEHKAKAAFFVAGFIGKFTGKGADPAFDEINRTIAEKSFDWIMIRDNCRRFCLFYSDNGLYVPPEKVEELAEHLGVRQIIIKNAGHFNASSGYAKFELLLKGIRGKITKEVEGGEEGK